MLPIVAVQSTLCLSILHTTVFKSWKQHREETSKGTHARMNQEIMLRNTCSNHGTLDVRMDVLKTDLSHLFFLFTDLLFFHLKFVLLLSLDNPYSLIFVHFFRLR